MGRLSPQQPRRVRLRNGMIDGASDLVSGINPMALAFLRHSPDRRAPLSLLGGSWRPDIRRRDSPTVTLQPMSASILPQHFNAVPACAALIGDAPAWMSWIGLGLAVAGIDPGNATFCLTFGKFDCANLHGVRAQCPAVGRKHRCNTLNRDRERQSLSFGFEAGRSVSVVSDPFSQMPLSSTPFS